MPPSVQILLVFSFYLQVMSNTLFVAFFIHWLLTNEGVTLPSSDQSEADITRDISVLCTTPSRDWRVDVGITE